MKPGQIKSGLGALRKSVASVREESRLMKEIGEVVEACLKDPSTALQKFEVFMDQRRKSQRMGPGEGFVRVDVDGEVVLLTAEEAQEFIDEAEAGPEQERRIAAKMKRILTCQPEELFAEAVFIRMLVEATLDKYRAESEGDESDEAKELKSLILSVETRLKRRMTVLQEDNNSLEVTEKGVTLHRKSTGMDVFEQMIKQLQEVRAQNNIRELQRLGGEIQAKRSTYERATNAIQPNIRTCKINRRDIQVHISIFLRYLEALVHKQKEALVSSISGLRQRVEQEGGAEPPPDLAIKEKQLESIEQQEQFVSKSAREADAVAAAITAAEGLPPSKIEADVGDIMQRAEVQAMKKKPAEKPKAEPEAPTKRTGMHIKR